MTGPDYIVNIGDGEQLRAEGPSRKAGRLWLAIRWRCCSVYSRVYRNADASAYQGRCPRCGREVQVPVRPDGTHHRFFDAY